VLNGKISHTFAAGEASLPLYVRRLPRAASNRLQCLQVPMLAVPQLDAGL
jgi:hypothetical protein